MSDSPAPYTVPPVSDEWTPSTPTPVEWSDGTDEALLAPDHEEATPVAAPGVGGGVVYPSLPPIRSLTREETVSVSDRDDDPHVWQLPPDVTDADLSARLLSETTGRADRPATTGSGSEEAHVVVEPVAATAQAAATPVSAPFVRSESVGVWVPGPDDQPALGAMALAAEMGIDPDSGASTVPDPNAPRWDDVMPQIGSWVANQNRRPYPHAAR